MNIKALILTAIIAASFASGWHVNSWHYTKNELKDIKAQVKADEEMRERLFNVSLETQEAIRNIRIENKTIYQKTEREVLREPIYTECVLTEEGVSLINRAKDVK